MREKFLKKGSLVYIEGQIKTRKYTDQSGTEKYTTEIVLQQYNSNLTMLDNKSDNFNELESPNIESSLKQNTSNENANDFGIEDDEVPF